MMTLREGLLAKSVQLVERSYLLTLQELAVN
jgi:hypothetical protein